MGPIVKETCKFLEASTPANIEIRVEVEENLDLIMADPTQMHQVIMNLGTNAVQAMPPKGGVVEVLLKNAPVQAYSKLVEHGLNPGKHVELTVKDNGAGIPSHLYERLFEPYFTTKPMSEGAGLGLAVAHGIVTAHNGIILLNSRIGSGSRFTVYIPSISKSAALSETPERPVPTGKERILFVDDEAAIVEISGEMLEDLGYDTVTQTDAIQALNLFKSDPNRFDLVITDMSMPRLSGLEFAAEIIALRPEIPVVICTGFSSRLNEEEARQLGVRAFLLKPILRNQLAQTIRSVLDKEHMTC
jgi:CheY-like chemotaxis protein